MTSQGIGQNLKEMAELPKVSKVSADHLVDFNPPVYNVFSAALYLLKIPATPYISYAFCWFQRQGQGGDSISANIWFPASCNLRS